MIFDLVSVATGAVLDTITGDRPGELEYATGRARGIVATIARRAPEGRLLEVMADWSNGYVQLRRVAEPDTSEQ